jgi:hypothetical protein
LEQVQSSEAERNIFRRYNVVPDTTTVTRSIEAEKDRFRATDIPGFEGSTGEGFYIQREPVFGDIANVYWRITFVLHAAIILFVLLSY